MKIKTSTGTLTMSSDLKGRATAIQAAAEDHDRDPAADHFPTAPRPAGAGRVGGALVAAPAALADSVQSSNWAGYAVHRGGVRFKRVTGTWRQPRVTCVGGRATYSSVWVGLGGYSESSQALEQIGSEVDCNARGRMV